MIEIYKTFQGELKKIDKPEEGCWINVCSPTEEEKKYLTDEIKIISEFLKQALDEEESPHIDYDDDFDQRLIMIDYPLFQKDISNDVTALQYLTAPLGFISYNNYVITISLHECLELNDFKNGLVKGFNTSLKTRFFLTLMLRVSQRFLTYLRQIDKLSSLTETKLHKSMENQELIQMLGLEKSLVYFSTSLKTDEIIVNKILRGKIIKLYEEDQDLIDDVLIELHQAIEMCNIYSNILSGTMDAFASVISNNLNIVMKILTVITIVMSIPNMVFGFYGMNVEGSIPGSYWWIPLIISFIICLIVILIFKKKKMFK